MLESLTDTAWLLPATANSANLPKFGLELPWLCSISTRTASTRHLQEIHTPLLNPCSRSPFPKTDNTHSSTSGFTSGIASRCNRVSEHKTTCNTGNWCQSPPAGRGTGSSSKNATCTGWKLNSHPFHRLLELLPSQDCPVLHLSRGCLLRALRPRERRGKINQTVPRAVVSHVVNTKEHDKSRTSTSLTRCCLKRPETARWCQQLEQDISLASEPHHRATFSKKNPSLPLIC